VAGSAGKKRSGTGARVRARRDFQALQDRRMTAAQMFARGKRQVDVVDALGVSAQTASRWHRTFLAEGTDGLAGAGRAGRLPKLSDEQLAQVEQALLNGPRANGFPTEMWTLARVAEVIETLTGIRYGQTQTWTLLRERLRWSRQRPARRAIERNDEAIATWIKQDWPRIKKRAAPRRLDRLPRRERVLAPPASERHLGAQGADPATAPPILLDPAVDVGCTGLPARPQRGRADVPDQRRLLQHRLPDRVPHRPAHPLRGRQNHPDLKTTCPPTNPKR
jgi:transposase